MLRVARPRRCLVATLWVARVVTTAGALLSHPGLAQSAPGNAPGVAFMQGMIVHHAQAIEMSALMAGRTTATPVLRMGERITVSQRDEIALMAAWLRERGAEVPELSAGHAHHGHGAMPGMATSQEMADLATRRGRAFDRRFLELMIRHHEGALVMVKDVLGAAGGPNDGELFRFASDVDADQRAEIRRMQSMLAGRSPAAARKARRRT